MLSAAAAAAIMSRHGRNVGSKVPVKRAATRCQVVERERNKISAAIRCVLWGQSLQSIMGWRWVSGTGCTMFGKVAAILFLCRNSGFFFLALSICDSDQNSQILAHFLQCNSCRIIIQMETFCVLPCICSLLHSSNKC